MEVIAANIYQRENGKLTYGISIRDTSKNPITNENIIWWLVVNIIRRQRYAYVSADGFKLDKKIFISVLIASSMGTRKYNYAFSISDEVDKRFKYEGKFYTISDLESNADVLNNLEPILDTVAFSTIEKNKNFSFLISVPMQS